MKSGTLNIGEQYSMAYLPKHKEKAKDAIGGKLKDLKTGLPFNGKFIRDFLGNFYKGDKFSASSEKLLFEPDWNDIESDSRFGIPIKTAFIKPSENDFAKGILSRYFVKEANTGKITEVDTETYKALRKEGKIYRKVLKIEWYITGNPEDEIINGFLFPGTKAKNQDVINQAEKILPGIGEQILKDPGQFVRK